MAQRTITITASDISGQEPATRHTLALDGAQVTIDLTDAEFTALHDAVTPFLAAGHKVGRGSAASTGSRTRSGGTPNGVDPKAVRAWAALYEGKHLPAQGRIPRTVVEQYLTPGTDNLTPIKGVDKVEIARQEAIRKQAQAQARANA